MREYLKPSVRKITEEITFLRADAQYIVKTTDEYCPGESCGRPGTIEFMTGSDAFIEYCLKSGEDPVGLFKDFKCLETGKQVYHEVVVGLVPGGSQKCDEDQTAVILHLTFNPSLPPVCTVTSLIEKGVDQCQESCN